MTTIGFFRVGGPSQAFCDIRQNMRGGDACFNLGAWQSLEASG